MRCWMVLASLLVFGRSAGALAALQEKTGIGIKSFYGTPSRDTDPYRLGDEWGKSPVNLERLNREGAAFQRAALATATVGGGTGFFLGEFNGKLVMATNHHVYSSSWSCSIWGRVQFPLLGVRASCDEFIGTWPDVDLALFTIKVNSPADRSRLIGVAGNFLFGQPIRRGTQLLTIGFGSAGNPGRQVMANQDGDCYVFSGDGQYRKMADPDRLNPGSYRAWSFAIGCDVSHGDSGSAIVDRETSAVLGIIWTGRIPKSQGVKSSTNLTRMYESQDPLVWEELSYAVPAEKVAEHLNGLLLSGALGAHAATVQAILQ